MTYSKFTPEGEQILAEVVRTIKRLGGDMFIEGLLNSWAEADIPEDAVLGMLRRFNTEGETTYLKEAKQIIEELLRGDRTDMQWLVMEQKLVDEGMVDYAAISDSIAQGLKSGYSLDQQIQLVKDAMKQAK